MRTYILFSFLLLLLTGCGGSDTFTGDNNTGDNNDVGGTNNIPVLQTRISQHNTTISHTDTRRGRNCMECHYEGNNSIVYTIAGTVYQLDDFTAVYPNATVKFYSGVNGGGALLATLEVDANGNFYTTEPMELTTGVYPMIEGTAGETPLHMGNFITHGQCNSCHGNSTLPIYMGQELVENVERVSAHGLTLSHTDDRRGTDCTTCHDGYTISGSVKDLGLENYYADATVYFYDEPNGAGRLVETLEVDGNGNFYTTQNVNFGVGLYPVIASADGVDLQHMTNSTLNGACNSCHGVTNIAIYSGEKVNKLISQHGTTTSHIDERRGQNCMNCHIEGTGNPYIYTMAGTVYQQADPTQVYPNATIYLHTEANGRGDLITRIEVDANGNFFTTEPLKFNGGMYPSIAGNTSEDPVYMANGSGSGQCNSCHDGAGMPIVVPGEAVQRVSANGTSFSHTDGRRGVDCLGCHNIGGNNPYQYSVAGTVYQLNLVDFYADGTISLYSGPNGTGDLVATIEIDANGNFFTTEPVDLGNGQGNGVYPAVTGREVNSPTLYMNESTNDGGCSNSGCHGVNRPPIFAQ
ncbi:hypothetical protein [Kaarinaea lacus]